MRTLKLIAAIERDGDKRKAMYAQLDDIFVDQAFVMALAIQTICMVATSRVQGIAPLWHHAFSFKEAWLSA